jgi:hypothetical protein
MSRLVEDGGVEADGDSSNAGADAGANAADADARVDADHADVRADPATADADGRVPDEDRGRARVNAATEGGGPDEERPGARADAASGGGMSDDEWGRARAHAASGRGMSDDEWGRARAHAATEGDGAGEKGRGARADAATDGAVPDEERRAAREPYAALLARLSRQSVHKRYECYRAIDWDAPVHRIDPDDPRFELTPDDPLGATAWYRALPPARRARIGLHRVATFMKVGLQFENVLSRGLLAFALTLPERAPEQRYAYHELIEESHHSMMFAEFIRRTGLDIHGIGGIWARVGDGVAALGARFPELFFVFVLGGEDPIDHAQRLALAGGGLLHPLLRRICQIHVTEEARHLCFARSFLREHVPRLSPSRRLALAVAAPAVLRLTAELMLRPSPQLVYELGVPPAVVAEAFTRNPTHRDAVMVSLDKVGALARELGLVTAATAPLWRALAPRTTATSGAAA